MLSLVEGRFLHSGITPSTCACPSLGFLTFGWMTSAHAHTRFFRTCAMWKTRLGDVTHRRQPACNDAAQLGTKQYFGFVMLLDVDSGALAVLPISK